MACEQLGSRAAVPVFADFLRAKTAVPPRANVYPVALSHRQMGSPQWRYQQVIANLGSRFTGQRREDVEAVFTLAWAKLAPGDRCHGGKQIDVADQ